MLFEVSGNELEHAGSNPRPLAVYRRMLSQGVALNNDANRGVPPVTNQLHDPDT